MVTVKKQTNSTTNKKRVFLKTFKQKACNISLACESADIHRSTFYIWMEKDPKFAERVQEHQEALLDFTESKLMMNIKEGKEASIFFHLKTRGKKRGYIERQEIEHSGEDTSRPTKIEIVAPKGTKVKKK